MDGKREVFEGATRSTEYKLKEAKDEKPCFPIRFRLQNRKGLITWDGFCIRWAINHPISRGKTSLGHVMASADHGTKPKRDLRRGVCELDEFRT
jgi:hypothetical protein